LAFEEQINSIIAYIPDISGYLIWGSAGCVIATIIGYFAYWMTFNRIVIIKERVGKEFDVKGQPMLVSEEAPRRSSLSGLAQTFSDPMIESIHAQPWKAIPTITRLRRGKVIKRHGKYYLGLFRFLASAQRLKLVGDEFWNLSGSKKRIELMKLSERIYSPILTVYDTKVYSLAKFDEDYIDWVINDIEEDKRKFHQQGFWERYGVWVMTGVTMIICLIFVMVVFKNLQPFADAGARGAEAIGQSCASLLEQNI